MEVHQIVSAAATLYEKVRYLIDYHEEHTIRRSAIERMLKRWIFIQGKTIDAPSLLAELVEGGYLAKGEATKEVARRIDLCILKFLRIDPLLPKSNSQRRTVLGFVASEIESLLAPRLHLRDDAVAEAFYQTIRTRIQGFEHTGQDLDVQTRCACRRALLGSDDATLSYALWLLYVPQWKEGAAGEIESIGAQVPAILEAIHRDIENPTQWQIAQQIKNESVYFRIIRELIQHDGSSAADVLKNPEKMETATREFLEAKYVRENTKIRTSGRRAVLYLLLTKIILAIVVELPYELYVLGGGSQVPLLINVVFHPLLLFSLTYRVGSLGEANTEAIIGGMRQILYHTDSRPIPVRTRTRFVKTFAVLYILLVVGVFGGILAILQALSFNIVSMFLFFLFFVFVSYFAFRIRYNAGRWKVLGDSSFSLMANLFAVPVVRTGQWLSRKFSTINVFVFIMDFIIETPFKHMLMFSNQFILYLKEKASEVR
jgi:hypothetical protein